MKKSKQKLIIEQIDRKLAFFDGIVNIEQPSGGWIKAIRKALKMSLRQFGAHMKITSQSAKEIEQREASESISIKSLKEAAKAMNMKFVYGFVPMDGSLNKMIEKKANEVSRKIVLRTSQSMKLEDQGIRDARKQKAIRDLAQEIKEEMPRYLWDLK